jgi:hypothetical protein
MAAQTGSAIPELSPFQHTIQIGNAVEQHGHFILASSSNATINLAGERQPLSFANSSGQAWTGAQRSWWPTGMEIYRAEARSN